MKIEDFNCEIIEKLNIENDYINKNDIIIEIRKYLNKFTKILNDKVYY